MNNDKSLALVALDMSGWSLSSGHETGGDANTAIEMLKAQATPLKEVEPRGIVDDKRGPKTERLMGSLRTIGAKIAPGMSEEQVNVWLGAMIVALSDLPFSFAIGGATEAIHVPMKFLNQVEEVVRDKAETFRVKNSVAITRLRNFEADLKRVDQPKLPEPNPVSHEELQSMSPQLRDLGISAGWLCENESGEIEWTETPQQQEENQ